MDGVARAREGGGHEVWRTATHDRVSREAVQNPNNFPICRAVTRR